MVRPQVGCGYSPATIDLSPAQTEIRRATGRGGQRGGGGGATGDARHLRWCTRSPALHGPL